MKKILLGIVATLLFASSNEDINRKLNLILNQIKQLQEEVKKKDKEIEKLKKELKTQQKEIKKQEITTKKEFAVKSCDKIRVVSLRYTYQPDFIPYYDLDIKMKNEYPEDIVFIRGSLFAEDRDGVKILQDYISRKVDFKAGSVIEIKKRHMVVSELEKYLKDEKPSDLRLYFRPTVIEFKNGQRLECP